MINYEKLYFKYSKICNNLNNSYLIQFYTTDNDEHPTILFY